jgi:DNA-directed RNA polymerase subunit alpha
MSDYTIVLPSKPKIVSEADFSGVYEIDGLYPGYGHTLGNSLRRIILSSLPGSAITTIKVAGATHEFSVLPGVKEDVITILLNLKKVRISMVGDEPQTLTLKAKGVKEVKAGDIKLVGGVEILNPDMVIATLTDKSADLDMEIVVERGLGFVSKETLQKNRLDIGFIGLDAIFTPVRRVSYEVENMRVGDRTDFNRLRILIETNGTIAPREALEQSIETMIHQLRAVIGFQESAPASAEESTSEKKGGKPAVAEGFSDPTKAKIAELGISSRIVSALADAGIKTTAGLVRKTPSALKELDGIGDKAVSEISEALAGFGLTLKGE